MKHLAWRSNLLRKELLCQARCFTAILFLANVGEEGGLLGSQYYTEHRVFPLANTVTDDVDKIDFPAMARRDQFSFHTAWAVANREQRLVVDDRYTPTAADLDRYVGTYASAQIPLKITFTKEGTTIHAQATGQPAFPLEAVSQGIFKFDPAGLQVDFEADKPGFTLKQGGVSFVFTKE